MKLTAEQIQDNWNKFLSIIDTHISEPRRSKLKAFYEQYAERIMLMPASHKKEYHNAFPGGYVDHVLRVVLCAFKLNEVWIDMGVDTSTYTFEELVFASLNHDLGKMGDEQNESYIPQTDQWRKEKLGEDYKFNDRLEFMSVPDRGLHLLMSHGVIFSRNEMLAIKLHDGLYDDANKPYLMSWSPETKPRTALVFIVHQADLMAARIEFEQVWMPKLKGEVTQNNSSNFTIEKNKKSPVKTKALSNIKSEGLKSLLDNI
jgi:hypothetical protein